MPKKRKKQQSRTTIIISAIIIILICIAIVFKVYKQGSEDINLPQQAASNIYSEVKSENEIFSITNTCSWSGVDVRCTGEVKDIETKPHSTSDIYIDLIAFDNDKKCGYCNNRINLGQFSVGEIRAYSLVCDIGKKVDILAKVTVSAKASQIFKGC